MKNDVYEIVSKLSEKSILTPKLIYKIKYSVDRSNEKYKSSFVARGFSRKEGVNYEETFYHTHRYTTKRSLISIDATMGWKIH